VLCHFGACSNQPNPSRAIISSSLLSVGQQAAHFDFAIRRVESPRPSHAFSESADFAACGAEPRIPWAFAGRGDWRPTEPGLSRRFCAPGLQCRFSNLRNWLAGTRAGHASVSKHESSARSTPRSTILTCRYSDDAADMPIASIDVGAASP
jgi:hypothetical protein